MVLICTGACFLTGAPASFSAENNDVEKLPEGQWRGVLTMDADEAIDLTMRVQYMGDYQLVTIAIPGKAAIPVINLKTENGLLTFIFTLDYNGIQCALETGDGGSFAGPCHDAGMNEYRMRLSPAVPEDT